MHPVIHDLIITSYWMWTGFNDSLLTSDIGLLKRLQFLSFCFLFLSLELLSQPVMRQWCGTTASENLRPSAGSPWGIDGHEWAWKKIFLQLYRQMRPQPQTIVWWSTHERSWAKDNYLSCTWVPDSVICTSMEM